MRQNLARRAALVDAAIEVLAREGARGLTFRAVDAEAEVPKGTASNYFANRDDLLNQAGGRIYERLRPDDATMEAMFTGPATRARTAELVRDVVERVTAFRTGYLALLELRLEATRRPELRAVLTERVSEDVEANVANHLAVRSARRRRRGQDDLSGGQLAGGGAPHAARRLPEGAGGRADHGPGRAAAPSPSAPRRGPRTRASVRRAGTQLAPRSCRDPRHPVLPGMLGARPCHAAGPRLDATVIACEASRLC